MVSLNLFKAPQAVSQEPSEDEEPALDPSYAHTQAPPTVHQLGESHLAHCAQLVYEILLRFVTSSEVDSAMMRKYVNTDFIHKVVSPGGSAGEGRSAERRR